MKAADAKRRVVYPGTFDPITNGHLDVIHRVGKLFDEVIVAIAAASRQKEPLFSLDERLQFLRDSLSDMGNVRVTSFCGLLAEFVVDQQVHAVVRGLRAISDFEFEVQMALVNRNLAPFVETIFIPSKEEYTYLSSRVVKEIAFFRGNVGTFVPPNVARALREKFLNQTHEAL